MQKAGIILAGTAVGGFIYLGLILIDSMKEPKTIEYNEEVTKLGGHYNSFNQYEYKDKNQIVYSAEKVMVNPKKNLVNFNDDSNALEMLLQCINGLGNICLVLIFFLCIQLFYKYYVSDKPSLKFLERILPTSYSDKVKKWIYKLISLNKKMSSVYIVLILILLLISMLSISYFSLELITHLNDYSDDYIRNHKK